MKQNISGFAPSISLHLPVNDFFNCSGLKWTLQILKLLSVPDFALRLFRRKERSFRQQNCSQTSSLSLGNFGNVK